ncbi:MAG: type I DNA topoisomerase [Fimbriimonadaceae bacterium]
MSKTLVVVESPAKARTISRFLGKDYEVLASFGHIRDLPEKAADIPASHKDKKWAKLGVNVEGDFEPLYIIPADKKRHITALKDAAKGTTRLLLATDEDREGESISYHILEVLKPKKDTTVERIVFHEITPEAINAAIASPRQLDVSLVRAQETRRILDRLYGYTLSPLLWKKVAPKLSAGRVQSVAVRLVVMRERERRDFITVEYAGVTASLAKGDIGFKAKLDKINAANIVSGQSFSSLGELIKPKENWLKINEAAPLADKLKANTPWTVTDVETKPGVENPPVPFMTSTLQQEANRKLGFPARRTMQVAQNLYEGIDIGGGSTGLITYMRTDSLSLAERAVQEARDVIQKMYGMEYLPASPKVYKSKAKNAQEAHEAIRPTDLSRTPASIKSRLTDEQFKLYDLIWKRTIACQMNPARVERTRAELFTELDSNSYTFSTTGKRIVFPGFLRVYVEGFDDPDAELGDKETLLPELKKGEQVPAHITLKAVEATEHSTKPPARYTEASLVQKLEAEGIGRPSTYASIIGTIQDRGYVFKAANQLVPTFTAFAVTQLLEGSFPKLIDIGFTAEMENELDEIADGTRDMVAHLKEFYYGDKKEPGILDKVEKEGPDIPFPHIPLGEDIVIRIGRNGPFIQRGEGGPGNTASIPEDLAPADLTYPKAIELLEQRAKGPESVGTDSKTGRAILSKTGRFGPYLELEQTGEEIEAKLKPTRVGLPPGVTPAQLTEDDLATLTSYPKVLGVHPETNEPINLLLGRYGPYLQTGSQNANAGDWKTAPDLTVEAALQLIVEGGKGRKAGAPEPLKELGEAEGCAGPIKVMSGRYGPYVTDGTTNATIPKGTDPESVTIEQASELIKARAAAGPSKRPKRKFTRKK